MHNTFHLYLSILFVPVTLALFGVSFDLNGNRFFRVIVETDRMFSGNCISSPMRCQCWVLVKWLIPGPGQTAFGWEEFEVHSISRRLCKLIVVLLFLNAYFINVFFCFASSNVYEKLLRCCPLLSPPNQLEFQVLSLHAANFDHYPNDPSRFSGNFPKMSATFLKEKFYFVPFLLYLLVMVLLLVRPTHLGRSVMQCWVVGSYRHKKWADSITCHLVLSKWCVMAMWLHRAWVDAEQPIPKPFSARAQ